VLAHLECSLWSSKAPVTYVLYPTATTTVTVKCSSRNNTTISLCVLCSRRLEHSLISIGPFWCSIHITSANTTYTECKRMLLHTAKLCVWHEGYDRMCSTFRRKFCRKFYRNVPPPAQRQQLLQQLPSLLSESPVCASTSGYCPLDPKGTLPPALLSDNCSSRAYRVWVSTSSVNVSVKTACSINC
jgi:hypothetical protein